MYAVPGGSKKVASEIEDMAARIRREEAEAEAAAAAAAAEEEEAGHGEVGGEESLQGQRFVLAGAVAKAEDITLGNVPPLVAGGNPAKDHLVEEKYGLPPAPRGSAAQALTVPKASESALLSKVSRKQVKGGVGGGREGYVEEGGEEEEDPMAHNARQVYESRHTPIWLHSKHKVPQYVLNGGVLGKVPYSHKPAEDPDDEWGSVPKPYLRTHVADVQPWVMPEVKMALSKQGMKAQV